jgi:hypothetical protein
MPTTTNLGLTYPASTGYVSNGAADMGTLATGLDAYYAATTAYTPILTNVTGGTASGRFVRMGKLGFLFVTVTAGTATATGLVTATLPAGWTAARVQPVAAIRGNALASAYNAAGGVSTITLTKDSTGANFTTGDAVFTYRLQGWIELT